MRHRVKSVRLNRPQHQLKALVRNIVTSLILFEKIETTRDKAKFARGLVDRIITQAKKKVAQGDSMNAIRYMQQYLFDKNASKKVIEELVVRYKDRPSGFTRIVNTRIRGGDAAQLVQFQLVNEEVSN